MINYEASTVCNSIGRIDDVVRIHLMLKRGV